MSYFLTQGFYLKPEYKDFWGQIIYGVQCPPSLSDIFIITEHGKVYELRLGFPGSTMRYVGFFPEWQSHTTHYEKMTSQIRFAEPTSEMILHNTIRAIWLSHLSVQEE